MHKRIKILVIFGTRPEAIKMAPVVKELEKNKDFFQTVVCVTAQHRQMLDQMLSLFDIKADIDLNIMQENQTLENFTANAMLRVSEILKKIKPQLLLVQGDTTTAMIAALAGFYQRIPVGHIEAGLRTQDIYNPFPEEVNRHIISILATFNFAPTKYAFRMLLGEGISKQRIFLTGNTVIDALQMIIKKAQTIKYDFKISDKNKLILVTAHRRENFGRPLKNICRALKEIVRGNEDVEIIYPVHLNPNVKVPVYRMLFGIKRIHLTTPVDYHELARLLKRAYIVLTDSGGIQEEAPAFGRPVLVMRKKTERQEGIKANVAKIVGTDTKNILKNVELLLHNRKEYDKMARAINPYGDGHAAKRIVGIIKTNIAKLLPSTLI
ncbi:MAG: UDP-N-acetylglucosamine 2-epimerase (non-hydrolyzing) [Candidatus Omnitrophota bacterium]